MVVPVWITSCPASEKPKTGPVTAQITTAASARMKASGWPAKPAIRPAIAVNIRSSAIPLRHGRSLIREHGAKFRRGDGFEWNTREPMIVLRVMLLCRRRARRHGMHVRTRGLDGLAREASVFP